MNAETEEYEGCIKLGVRIVGFMIVLVILIMWILPVLTHYFLRLLGVK